MAVEYYFQRYGDLELHRRMIGDHVRTEAFVRAITEEVRPGDRVLDLGTGTGILAMAAAAAGAGAVVAIDYAEIAQTAANLVKQNGLAESVLVLCGPAQELQLPEGEQVDLIVSEWLGNMAFVENMAEDLLAARDRLLAPGGRMLPSAVEVKLAPIGDPILYHTDGPGFWRGLVAGFDFGSLEDKEQRQGRVLQTRIEASTLLSKPSCLCRLEMATDPLDRAFTRGDLQIEIARDAVLDGFAGWFVAELSPSVVLDTGPDHPETHWSQSYFSFPPRPVTAGERLNLSYALSMDEAEPRHMRVDLTLDGEHHRYWVE